MKFTYFKFENFKGIKNQKLDLSKNPDSKVYTLVGLNESGKTTILEAINYFIYKPESLESLDPIGYKKIDIHDLIPINERDNFNGNIKIEAEIELEEDDIFEIKREFDKNGIKLTSFSTRIKYSQIYMFENSIHQPDKNSFLWEYEFKGKKKRGKEKKLNNDDALLANPVIKKRMPSILYFPNFLFEFPERIYLDESIKDTKHKFYQKIIQDILDSLDNGTNIKIHLIERILSSDPKEKRNLNSLLGKMQKKITTDIFKSWNQILNKKITNTEIIIYADSDDNGTYLEFNIKDDVDTYRVTERSLGFRWFFVYILFTQFRSYRKKLNNVFFLFDEPASNLHPSAQQELLKSFENLPKVMYTTHSHYLINPKWLENTFVIKNEGIDYEHEEDFFLKNTNIKIFKYREFAFRFPNQSSYFQPILDLLDYRPTNLEFVPNAIICEGKNDYYLLDYFQKIIKEDNDSFSFIPGTSGSKLNDIISLYLGWGRKFFVLLDSDKEGQKQKKRYLELFGISLENNIFTYEDIKKDWKNFEVENLISEQDKIDIQNICYPTNPLYNKKIFNRSIQELYAKNQKIELSSSSYRNLEKVIKFFKDKI